MAELPGYDACVVNKTFLELAPAPVPGQLQRSQTAPPRFAPMPVTNISLCYDDPDYEIEKDEEHDGEGEGDDEVMPPPPPPSELQRLQTYNVFDEPGEHWQWNSAAADCAGLPRVTMAQMVPVVYAAPVAVHMEPMNHLNSMPANINPMGHAEQQGIAQDARALPGGGAPGPPAVGPPMPQTLQRSTSVSTRASRIEWTVDARKLRGNDKQAVSPSFDLVCAGRTLPFKMMIYPKQVTDQKGGASFKKSKGRGTVTIKCEADLNTGSTPLQFRVYTGTGASKQTPRGPVEHDFSESAVCTLPRNIEEWDFEQVKDKDSSTFVVGLEVLTQ